MPNEGVTEESATHCAVGDQSEVLNLRVRVYWRAGGHGFRIVLRDGDETEEYGTWDVSTADPMPGETLPDSRLDHLVATALSKFRLPDSRWVTDPASLAAVYSLEWGWSWRPERRRA
ncbi:hypothetical protein [Streptomyces misionensis]|uniref:hypothetical protein n=1 Tax=Streptomyces misionensis TaxID=67331 RepID=UPI0036A16E2F